MKNVKNKVLSIAFAGLMIFGLSAALDAQTYDDSGNQRYYGSKYRDNQNYRDNDDDWGYNDYSRRRHSSRQRDYRNDRYRNHKYRSQHFSRREIRRMKNEIERNERRIYKLERKIKKLLRHHRGYRNYGRYSYGRKIKSYEREIDQLFYRNRHLKRLLLGSKRTSYRSRYLKKKY